jgi:1,2-diacylglycerol 3-alpha-glucosyltransferase
MKILQICQSYPPMISGAARFAAELAEGLTGAGHEVLVIAASDRSEGGYGEENGRLRIERLPSRYNPARVGQRFLLWPQRVISEWVAAFQPDVVHSHDPLALALCALRAANRQQIPVLLTMHQLPWFVSKYRPTFWVNPISIEWLLWRYGSWLLRRCAATIAPTQPVAKIVWQQTGCCAHVIPCGTDLRRFQAGPLSGAEAMRLRTQLGLSAEKPIILHVGRLDMDKDAHLVVAAAARVMEQVDAELLLVGDGRQRDALESLCAVLGIADRSHFTGFLAHDAGLPDVYRLADVFVTASEIETFGLVLLEAMASACPVVAVQTACVAETVRDKECGFLVRPRDVAGLAEKMIWLLENRKAAEEMGLAGQTISGRYSKEAMVQAHVQLYQTALGQAHSQLTGVILEK